MATFEDAVRAVYTAVFDALAADSGVIEALLAEALAKPEGLAMALARERIVPRLVRTVGAWLRAEIEAGRCRDLPLPLLMPQLIAPIGVVAGAVAHALTNRRPRTRYPVGARARLLLLRRVLPDRVRDRMFLRAIGLKPGRRSAGRTLRPAYRRSAKVGTQVRGAVRGQVMSFASPTALLALAVVPLTVAALLLAQRRRARYAVRFPALDVLAQVSGQAPRWRRYLPAAAFLLAIATLLVGAARPTTRVPVPREEATVMLVIDTSGSMSATDVEPNRMEAARAAAARFVRKLPARFRIGVVSFSGEANTLVQPTTDRAAVEQALASLHADGGTAIGDGLGVALDAIEAQGQQPGQGGTGAPAGEHPPSVTLLLSDGANTTGSDPQEQADRARRLNVPVFTIALGTPGGVLGGPGGQVRPVAPDPESLARIAATTNARFFEAATSENLARVYEGLGSRIGFRIEQREVTVAFAAAGLVLLLITLLLRSRWIARLP